jgi:adenylate cyclase
MARDVYARGLLGVRSLVLTIALAGLVFGVAIVVALDRLVLRRVSSLSADVREIAGAADPTARVRVAGDDELTTLGHGINAMLSELASAREVIRAAFGRYVSEEVAHAVLSQPELARLGGETRIVTILFSDIRGYSTIAEHLAPAEVVTLLNDYFGAMGEVVEAEGGCVIELLGDAILAVFGAPGALPDHATRALRAAVAMQRRGDALNREWDESGRSALWRTHGISALRSRIGLHTGPVVAGNLGSRTRMKYAVIGDTVNTAARVEGLNGPLGTDVLFTAEVFEAIDATLATQARDLGEHAVKGRERPVHVYTLEAPTLRDP